MNDGLTDNVLCGGKGGKRLSLSLNTCTLTLLFVVVLNFEVMQQQQLIITSSRPSYEGSYKYKIILNMATTPAHGRP